MGKFIGRFVAYLIVLLCGVAALSFVVGSLLLVGWLAPQGFWGGLFAIVYFIIFLAISFAFMDCITD